MSPEERLRQLIEDAKIRREEARKAQVKQLRDDLRATLTRELCDDILKSRYEWSESAGHPIATFTTGLWTWRISENSEATANGQENDHKWRLHISQGIASRGPAGFDSMDDLLLVLDEAYRW